MTRMQKMGIATLVIPAGFIVKGIKCMKNDKISKRIWKTKSEEYGKFYKFFLIN